jgi:integrase
MKGSIYRRCTLCGHRVERKRCPGCGSDSFTWAFTVDVGTRPDGRRRQRRRMGFESKRDAERALRELLHKIDTERFVDRTSLTLADYLRDEWLPAVCPPNLRESTWQSYQGELGRHVIPHLGGVKLQKLNAVHLNRLYAQLLADGRTDGKGGLSPRTVRYIHTVIRKALSDAVRWGRIERNVADLADPPRRNGHEADRHMRTWSRAQLRKFLEHVRDERLYAAWHLAAMTGMRRGEVLGLRWTDVDLKRGRLAVRQTYVSIDGVAQFSEPKTPRSRRTIDLDAETVTRLRTWQTAQAAEREAWGPAWHEHGLAFTNEDGTPLEPDGFSKRFVRYAKQAGLPPIRLHDLRHTHASMLLAAGVNPKVASERLGHHSTAFTLDVYSHVVPGMQADAAALIAGQLRAAERTDDEMGSGDAVQPIEDAESDEDENRDPS